MNSDVSGVIEKIGMQGLFSLVALVAERSVTRAAESLKMSQPAMSNVLARLRKLLEDPVLVRTPNGMEPTALARALAEKIRPCLLDLEAAFSRQRPFVPATAAGDITIATSDSNSLALASTLALLRGAAPGLKIVLKPPHFGRIRQSLEEGECDLAIGYFPDAARGLRQSTLYSEPHRCIVSNSHSLIRSKLTLEQYATASHVGMTSLFAHPSTGDQALNHALAALGVTRKIDVSVPSPLLYGYLVAATELLATVGLRLAEYFEQVLPVRIVNLPFNAPDLHISMLWHERTHQIGAYQWARQMIRDSTASMSLR